LRLALHEIRSYPFDLEHPVFTHYPAMKFGDLSAVRHFARQLTPLAVRLHREQRDGDWVLTSPPVQTLPSGANLLCEAVHKELRRRGISSDLSGLRLEQDPQPFESEEEFRALGDYAKLDREARVQSQAAEAHDIRFAPEDFRDKHVIFVNDINVTGAQMQSMHSLLSRARPRSLNWLLIVDVAPEIGRRHPGLESEINHSRLAKDDELIAFLRRAELRYTGKFVARLLSFGSRRLAGIFRHLDAATRDAIRDAVVREGSYSRDFFSEKIAAACESA
jgi:PRTase ComF-like